MILSKHWLYIEFGEDIANAMLDAGLRKTGYCLYGECFDKYTVAKYYKKVTGMEVEWEEGY